MFNPFCPLCQFSKGFSVKKPYSMPKGKNVKGENIMYRTVYDLNKAEMEELKDAYFWSDETDEEILENIDAPWEIPDEVIYNHFSGVSFVDEDFFCNCNDYAGFPILE